MRIIFHEAAEYELNDAAAYYEGESPGLGAAFLDDVTAALTSLAAHLEANPKRYARIRRKQLLRFPYSVLYSFSDDVVRVLAIAHHRRRPFYWRRRR